MSIVCKIGMHAAAAETVWNNGFFFSACTRCGCDLVRGAHSRWQPVPKRFKVVWRPRPEGYPDWSRIRPEEDQGFRLLSPATSINPSQKRLSGFVARG